MTTPLELNIKLHSTLIAMRKLVLKYECEIAAIEQLGVNGYHIMLGQGAAATLAKVNERGQMGYFGHAFISGTPLAMKQWVDGWNAVYTEPEHQAHVAGPMESIEWFTKGIAMMNETIRKGEAKLAEK